MQPELGKTVFINTESRFLFVKYALCKWNWGLQGYRETEVTGVTAAPPGLITVLQDNPVGKL